ncbi:MAG: hypothetical protein ACR2MG_00660 [Pyrinomonadaceae bacterium]
MDGSSALSARREKTVANQVAYQRTAGNVARAPLADEPSALRQTRDSLFSRTQLKIAIKVSGFRCGSPHVSKGVQCSRPY